MATATKIKPRRGSASGYASASTVLDAGEMAVVTGGSSPEVVFGDGSTPVSGLVRVAANKAGIAGHFMGTGILPLLKAHGRTVFPNLSGTDLAPIVRTALSTIAAGEPMPIPPVINLDGSSGKYVWNSNVAFLAFPRLQGFGHKGGNPYNAGTIPSSTTIEVASGVIAMTWGSYGTAAHFAGGTLESLTFTSQDGTGAVLLNIGVSHCTHRDLNISGFTTGLPSAFTASISSATSGGVTTSTLTVTAITSAGPLVRGSLVSGTGVAAGTRIDDYLTGTPGGVGTYSLLVNGVATAQTVSSRAMTGETMGVVHLENFGGSAAGQYSDFESCHFHNNYRNVTSAGYNGVTFDAACYFDPGNNGSVMAGSIGIRNIGGDTWRYNMPRLQGCGTCIDDGGQYSVISAPRLEIFGDYGVILRGQNQTLNPGGSFNAHLASGGGASSQAVWITPTATKAIIYAQQYGAVMPEPVLDQGANTIRMDGKPFRAFILSTPITGNFPTGGDDSTALQTYAQVEAVGLADGLTNQSTFCRYFRLINTGAALAASTSNYWFIKVYLRRADGSSAELGTADTKLGLAIGATLSIPMASVVVEPGGMIVAGFFKNGSATALGPLWASGTLLPAYQ